MPETESLRDYFVSLVVEGFVGCILKLTHSEDRAETLKPASSFTMPVSHAALLYLR
jgi:hypothetical protein